MDFLKDKTFQYGVLSGLFISVFPLIAYSKLYKAPNINQNIHNQDQEHEEEEKALLMEQLVRNRQFFGEEGQLKVEQSYVIVFGVGGVGSHLLSALARAGVGKLDIVDFDRVTLSSLNRHAFANRTHVNRSKVEVFKEFIRSLVPDCDLTIHETFVTPENVPDFFGQRKPDFVVDCIDNIDAKAALVVYCVKNKIPILASCGAGMKCDPTRIQIRDISETSYDSLARALRMKIKKHKIKSGFKVVYSNEHTERELLPLKEHQEDKADEFRPYDNYRLRIVPVLGTMPALIAYSMASYVLCELAGQPYTPYIMDDVASLKYDRMLNNIVIQAKKIGVRAADLEIGIDDVYIIVREAYEWKCFLCDKKYSNLELVRWDITKGFDVYNLVPVQGNCCKNHQMITNQLEQSYSDEIFKRKKSMDNIIRQFIDSKQMVYR